MELNKSAEETLDPQNWDKMRQLGHRMLDDMFDYLQSIREEKTWVPIPDNVKSGFKQPVPYSPQDMSEVYEDFVNFILPYKEGNIHPRFWGWVEGTGTPFGMLAELLASGVNPNAAGGENSATYVENQVIDWFKGIFDFPAESSGIIVSGGSMANLVGLTVARNIKADVNIREKGVLSTDKPLIVYGSTEMHSSLQKAIELLGLGNNNLRRISVEDDFKINLNELKEQIEYDKKHGCHPICVIGNAGTTNTGAIDDLNALADICEVKDLWFHIDGAFGSLVALNSSLKKLVSGIERADSLAFDFHKWMYLQYEAGCTLIRSKSEHFKSFTLTPDYMIHGTRGPAGGDYWFSDFGVELSRGFRALKIWMCIKHQGIDKFGRMIKQNIDQAKYLEYLINGSSNLEILSPVSLNVVCFRFDPGNRTTESLNSLNEEILLQLQESGVAVLSSTILHGKYALRAAITNQRTIRADLDMTVKKIVEIGDVLKNDFK